MIINCWSQEFTSKYDHVLPESYLCFDTEYTGSDAEQDLILEIGHTMVEGKTVIDQASHVLNWYAYPGMSADWLNFKLSAMRSVVGPNWRFDRAFLETHGKNPLDILRFYYTLFETWASRDLYFVAQNGQQADEKLFRANFSRYLKKPFALPDNRYFDTGAIFKATQIYQTREHLRQNVLPQRNDTLKTYFNRIIQMRLSGLRWSLTTILEHYDLINRQKLDLNQYHSAGFDSNCLHWIMEEYRKQIAVGPFSPAQLEQLFHEELANPTATDDSGLRAAPVYSPTRSRQRLR